MQLNKRKYRKVFYKGDLVYHVNSKGVRIYGIVKRTFSNLVLIQEDHQTFYCDGWHNTTKVFLNFHHIKQTSWTQSKKQ